MDESYHPNIPKAVVDARMAPMDVESLTSGQFDVRGQSARDDVSSSGNADPHVSEI